MPRGIPNVKRDESQGMRYTTFHVPPQYVLIARITTLPLNATLRLNPKHMSTSYLKTEMNTMWGRKAARSKTMTDEPPPEVRLGPQRLSHFLHNETHNVLMCADWRGQGRRGSHVVVFHLGSRYLRVGRASDVTPVTVPNVIARKTINPPAPTFIKGIFRPGKARARALLPLPANSDEYAVARGSDDPVRPILTLTLTSHLPPFSNGFLAALTVLYAMVV